MHVKNRTPNDHFDILAMATELTKYAKLKTCGWDWELSDYSKSRRGQGPDHAGLLRYVKLLGSMLAFLPNAAPLPLQVKEVWLYLQRHHQIMSPSLKATSKSEDAWATDAANTVCIMFHHLRSYRSSQTTFLSPEVLGLVQKIPSEGVRKQSAPVENGAPRKLAKRDSETSCQICTVTCKCPECCPRVPLEIDTDDPDDVSETSQAAQQNQATAELRRTARMKRPAAVMQRPAAVMKRPGAASGDEGPGVKITIVKRLNPENKKFTYIMQNKAYLCGLSKKQREDHENVIKAMADEIESSGRAWSKDEAAKWISAH